MPERTNSEEEREVRRIARDALWAEVSIDRVETITRENAGAHGEILLQVSGDFDLDTFNAFAGRTLVEFLQEGYVPTSVGVSEDSATAWFQPVGVGIDVEQ